MNRTFVFFAAVLVLSTMPLAADEKADEVMKGHFARKSADFTTMSASLMLVDGKGHTLTRAFDRYSVEGDDAATYIEVTQPADIAGVRFLIRTKDGKSEQRLYLPELKKSRKIAGSGSSGSSKGGRFLGSDICYYDLETRKKDDALYSYVGKETIDGIEYHLIDAVAVDEECPYGKSRLFLKSDNLFIYKTILYDKSGTEVKRIDVLAIETSAGIDFPKRMVIKDLVRDHTTLYEMRSIKVNTPIAKNRFSLEHLER